MTMTQMELQAVQNLGRTFRAYIETMGKSRELSLALTKLDEAEMWALKHLNAQEGIHANHA